jgi:hypothetical protein
VIEHEPKPTQACQRPKSRTINGHSFHIARAAEQAQVLKEEPQYSYWGKVRALVSWQSHLTSITELVETTYSAQPCGEKAPTRGRSGSLLAKSAKTQKGLAEINLSSIHRRVKASGYHSQTSYVVLHRTSFAVFRSTGSLELHYRETAPEDLEEERE